MKVLHTIHAVGEYAGTTMRQTLHDVPHNDLALAYYDINEFEEVDRNLPFDQFTTVNEHGIFVSCPCVAESYGIVG